MRVGVTVGFLKVCNTMQRRHVEYPKSTCGSSNSLRHGFVLLLFSVMDMSHAGGRCTEGEMRTVDLQDCEGESRMSHACI